MKNRDGYIGVEMQHVVRNLLSLDRADNVSISLHTVSKKMAALKDMKENEFAVLKQTQNVDAILPRVVVLEQTLITFGYREMQVFERELAVGLIVEKSIPPGYGCRARQNHRLNLQPCTRKFVQHVPRLSFASERDAAFPHLPSEGRNAFGACCPPNHSSRVVGENRSNCCA
jgi:hypothetical protein